MLKEEKWKNLFIMKEKEKNNKDLFQDYFYKIFDIFDCFFHRK